MPRANSPTSPALGRTLKGNFTFPTPDVTDALIPVEKNVRAPDYVVSAYGAPHPETALYPDHRLVLIAKKEDDGDVAIWYYQKFPGSPRVSKSIGTPNLTPQKYRRKVTTVTTKRDVTSDTDPAPLSGDETERKIDYDQGNRSVEATTEEVIDVDLDPLIGKETDEFGDLTTSESLVDDGTPTDSSAGVKRSQVAPLGNGKSIKTTASRTLPSAALTNKSLGQKNLIPEKYRRLIRTVETNQEVSPTYTFPTALTGDQTSVELAQETIRIARLKIIEEVIDVSADPLTGHDLGEYGNITITESLVNDGTAIDSGFLVIKSSVDPLGNGKSIKITASVANYPQTAGQTYNKNLDIVEQFTLDVVASASAPLGTNRKDITPMDSRRSQVKTVNISAIAAVLNAYSVTYPSRINLNLPDIITSITPVFETSFGDGLATESGSASAAGSNTSISLHGNISADGSATVMPEVIIEITRPWGQNKACTEYYFFLPNPVTESAILAKLPSVSAWPNFNPKSHTLVLKGQKVSRRAGVHFSYSSSAGSGGASTSYTSGIAQSYDRGSSIRAVTIPACIHDALSFSYSSSAAAAAGGARAYTEGLGVLNQDTGVIVAAATGSITPTSLAATPGASVIPTGTFLEHVDVQKYDYNYFAVRARVVTLP